ncbi:MAG: ABC transporter substrate-binding protein [Alphaproteobacteria bacterium]|nr:ABC transporter substrate-binding protein [Alphaproteobacteria bacterium]
MSPHGVQRASHNVMRLTGIALAVAFALTPAVQAKPQRVVSTNVCADQLALLLAPERVVSVSFNAPDPAISNFAEQAKGIPTNAARAEEIVLLKPDLILGDVYEGARVTRFAEVSGIPVQLVGAGSSIADVRQIIRDAAGALGEKARGEAAIAEMDARLSAIPRDPRVVRALVYEPSGITSGKGTLTDELLRAAGLKNVAPELMHGSYGAVPLEMVIETAPDLLVLDDSYNGSQSIAQRLLHHPAFRALKGRTRVMSIPSRLWLCPGPWVAEAAERLAAEKSRLLDSHTAPLAAHAIQE